MSVYLRDNPPVRSQFNSPRRARPTGLVVIHTAENVLDTITPDTGAEAVANFIRTRTTPGSYHDIADSDSSLQLVRYEDEAYQDGTGSNPYALSISFALRTTDWAGLSAERRRAFLTNGAQAFARQYRWLESNGFPTPRFVTLTREQSSAGHPGFISHALRDPARRTDPGTNFPWHEWIDVCRESVGGIPAPPVPTPPNRPPRLPWPFASGHYVGDIKGPAKSHGGYYATERPFVRNVQQWFIYRGCVSGVPASSWASNGWADGKFERPYSTNAATEWHRRFYPGQPYPEQIWRDDYERLTA